MADTIRYRMIPQGTTDYSEDQVTTTDTEGYVWHFGPNEAKVIPNFDYSLTLAKGPIVVDSAEQPAII